MSRLAVVTALPETVFSRLVADYLQDRRAGGKDCGCVSTVGARRWARGSASHHAMRSRRPSRGHGLDATYVPNGFSAPVARSRRVGAQPRSAARAAWSSTSESARVVPEQQGR